MSIYVSLSTPPSFLRAAAVQKYFCGGCQTCHAPQDCLELLNVVIENVMIGHKAVDDHEVLAAVFSSAPQSLTKCPVLPEQMSDFSFGTFFFLFFSFSPL
jgi:hypothetical protein